MSEYLEHVNAIFTKNISLLLINIRQSEDFIKNLMPRSSSKKSALPQSYIDVLAL